MTAQSIGVGMLGTGFMARVHSHAAQAANGRLCAIVGSNQTSSELAAELLGYDNAYGTVDELIDDDRVNVVHVCTPNAFHFEHARAVLEAGKDLICEKPLALTVDQADVLLDLARGRVATVPFVYRFHPMVREARARVVAGQLGTLFTFQGSYFQDWLLGAVDDNWRVREESGGPSRAFADIGSHLVDLIEFVSGEPIARLTAIKRTVHSRRSGGHPVSTEDAACLLVVTESGAIGTVAVSQVAAGRKNRLFFELSGARASMAFNQERPETLWVGGRSSTEMLVRDPDYLSPDASRLSVLPAGHPMGYQDAFNAFVRDTYSAIRGEIPPGLPDFTDGLRAVQLTQAVLDSSSAGEWVATPALTSKISSETIERAQ